MGEGLHKVFELIVLEHSCHGNMKVLLTYNGNNLKKSSEILRPTDYLHDICKYVEMFSGPLHKSC